MCVALVQTTRTKREQRALRRHARAQAAEKLPPRRRPSASVLLGSVRVKDAVETRKNEKTIKERFLKKKKKKWKVQRGAFDGAYFFQSAW